MNIPCSEIPNQSKQAFVHHQQMVMLYKNLPNALGIALLNSLVVTFVLWPVAEQRLLSIWLGAVAVLVMLRAMAYFSFQRVSTIEQQQPGWQKILFVGVLMSGVLWGLLSLLFFHHGSIEHQMFIAFVVAGMCAGAVTTLSYSYGCVALFVSLVLGPLLYSLLMVSDSVIGYAMSFMTVIFWVGMLGTSYRLYRNERSGLAERFDSMERQRQLESNQVRIQMLIDTALDGVVMTDVNGAIKVFNPAAERMFGYTQHEALGADVSILMPDSYAFVHEQYMKDHLSGKRSALLGVARDLQGQRKNGEIFPLEVNLSEMNIHGQMMYSAILRDVTQRKALEDSLRQATRMAQNANRAKSEFLSGLSHEIRTPMNAIVGFADLLEHDDRLLEDQCDYVMEIKRAGGHLIELMSDVLDLSKIEAGKIKLDMTQIDVLSVINDTLALVQHMAQARQITVHTQLPQIGECHVYADATRLKQVILNLLSNATKYNREGGDIYVRCFVAEPGVVAITVLDTGRGISRDQQQKLFKPFERLDAEGTQIEGTGLGLMLSKHFVEVMGGKLSLESELGVGSEFKVELRCV